MNVLDPQYLDELDAAHRFDGVNTLTLDDIAATPLEAELIKRGYADIEIIVGSKNPISNLFETNARLTNPEHIGKKPNI